MLTVLIALFAVALVAPLIFRFADRNGFYVLAAVPAIGFIWLLSRLPEVLEAQHAVNAGAAPPGHAPDGLVQTYAWIPDLGIELSFRMDALAAFMGLIVLGVGALVLAYCRWYFQRREPRIGLLRRLLVAFAGAMLGLVTADDLILLYVFWELTTVFSYLLVGHNPTRGANRRAALTALMVTTFGGLAMLVGIVMIGVTPADLPRLRA